MATAAKSVDTGATVDTAARHPQPIWWLPIVAAMAALGALLTLTSNGYGFHRDELYFRMLPPAWGYVDQPPVAPLLVRWLSQHVADEPWAIRIPATLAAVASVLVVALITRELGGGRAAQALSAWGYAFAASPLLFGHVMLTSSLDLVAWPLVGLLVVRAVLRPDDRYWLATGFVVGLSMYNKLLIALFLVALAAGLALVGPRRLFRSPWVLGSAALALLIGLPNVVYQATHNWPELTMAGALADNNSGDVRVQMWFFLALLLGPPLTAMWVAGLVALWRRPAWRPLRFVAAGFPVLLVLVFVGGTQVYYPAGYLAVLFAAGGVPTAELLTHSRVWRWVTIPLLALNALVSVTLALPVVPESALGSTPIPGVNQIDQDSVGWPTYVRQVATVYDGLPPHQAAHAVVIASNYGEAGAVDRYGPALGIPIVYSAHNQLYFDSRPPASTRVAVVLGGQVWQARHLFRTCTTEAHLDNGLGVDNEEQGMPVVVCRGPRLAWPTLWQRLQHYD